MERSRFEDIMRLALAEAARAAAAGEVPVGAVLLSPEGEVVASAHNRNEELSDPTAHAELLVIREGASAAGSWRLDGHTLVATLEPCAMCAMAAVWARLGRVVYGAADPKAGAMLSLYNIGGDKRLNHRLEIIDGVLADEAGALLAGFFEERR
jgi:tRNA(adenine34) deaminase